MTKLQVYLDDGRVFNYSVDNDGKAREHAHAIAMTGYRHTSGNDLEHYPPHRVLKVKILGKISTKYRDMVTGT